MIASSIWFCNHSAVIIKDNGISYTVIIKDSFVGFIAWINAIEEELVSEVHYSLNIFGRPSLKSLKKRHLGGIGLVKFELTGKCSLVMDHVHWGFTLYLFRKTPAWLCYSQDRNTEESNNIELLFPVYTQNESLNLSSIWEEKIKALKTLPLSTLWKLGKNLRCW